jgi:thioredoxin-related protein
MKNYIIATLILLCSFCALFAKKKKKKNKASTQTTVVQTTNNTPKPTEAKQEINTNEIEWLTWEEAQKRMAIKPKKVYVDVYTDWCGWCKVMEKKTFTNPNVIAYMNEHFYAIRFNIEKEDNINFQGKLYKLVNGNNELGVQLLKGSLSYPTSIFFEENFANPQPVPGYLDIKNIQPILMYLGGNQFKTKSFEDFKKECPNNW